MGTGGGEWVGEERNGGEKIVWGGGGEFGWNPLPIIPTDPYPLTPSANPCLIIKSLTGGCGFRIFQRGWGANGNVWPHGRRVREGSLCSGIICCCRHAGVS